MKIPQILLLVLYAISLLLSANRHGKPRTAENFWYTLVSFGIVMSLLISGGFFN